MPSPQIVVDILTEAIFLDHYQLVTAPLGAYERLPWQYDNGKGRATDINFEHPYLGDEILYPPFQNQSTHLAPGVHLHWIVPAYLGRQYRNENGKYSLPAAPNRWIIERKRGESTQKWMVVSDYVTDVEIDETTDTITLSDEFSLFPIPPERTKKGKPPFFYLGKKYDDGDLGFPEEVQLKSNLFADKMDGAKLTVLGFGSTQFSANYANCKTVFGFHDKDGQLGDTYKISGRHAAAEDDILTTTIKQYLEEQRSTRDPTDSRNLKQFLYDELSLDLDYAGADTELPMPEKTVFKSAIIIDKVPEPIDVSKAILGVGNSGAEAVSALLAYKMTKVNLGEKINEEEELEQLIMRHELDRHLVDHGPKFIEARHAAGFDQTDGGYLYAFKEHVIGKTKDLAGYPLPEELYTQLNALNDKQHQLNESRRELESLRTQLYADWHKYMRAAYTGIGAHDNFPDRDDIQLLVEWGSLELIANKEAEVDSQNEAVKAAVKALIKLYCVAVKDKYTYEQPAKSLIDEKWLSEVADAKEELSNARTIKEKEGAQKELSEARQKLKDALQKEVADAKEKLSNATTIKEKEGAQKELSEARQELEDVLQEEVADAKKKLSNATTIKEKEEAQKELSEARQELKDVLQKIEQEEQLFQAIEKCQATIASYDQVTNVEVDTDLYPLKMVLEDPFWEPGEPVLAIDGFNFGKRTARNACKIDDSAKEPEDIEVLTTRNMSALPWCPFYMEWEALVENTPIDVEQVEQEQLTDAFFKAFELQQDAPKVYLKEDFKEASVADQDLFVRGATILNPFIAESHRKEILEGLAFQMKKIENNKNELKSYKDKLEKRKNQKEAEKATEQSRRGEKNPKAIKAIEKEINAIDKAIWPIKCQLDDLDTQQSNVEKRDKSTKDVFGLSDILCQQLSGFNPACQMMRQAPLLPIAEPLGFPSARMFTDKVKASCHGGALYAPAPTAKFFPIRSGALKISRLRFVDNFGLYQDLKNFDKLAAADTLSKRKLHGDSGTLDDLRHPYLPPRIVQPTRLNFHFLERKHERMTDNPNTTPVLGWLIPNFWNENILVFDSQGEALGSLEKKLGWQALPWETGSTLASKVSNEYFQRLLQKIIKEERENAGFFDAFLSVVEEALQHIAPAKRTLGAAKALLFGRPIAVVRVRAGLQIKGYPALNQSWRNTVVDAQKVFNLAEDAILERSARHSTPWHNVEFPLRLGEFKQLNDGLIGYWEEENQQLPGVFYAIQAKLDAAKDRIISRNDAGSAEAYLHRLQADGAERTFCALMDPRGALHATTGILPTRSLQIPPAFYETALAQMNIWFAAGPLLQYPPEKEDTEQIFHLNLPHIPDYHWQWREKNADTLAEVSAFDLTKMYDALPEIKRGHLVLQRAKK